MSDKISFVINGITVVLNLVDFTIVALTCLLFMISRYLVFNKLGILCMIDKKRKKLFDIYNDIVTVIVVLIAIIIPFDIII